MRPRLGWLAAMTLGFLGCSTADDPWKGQAGPPRVVASFPPLACFVRNVGGAQIGVVTICTGQGPHEYEYRAEHARALRRADLFLANGLGLDDVLTEKLTANG